MKKWLLLSGLCMVIMSGCSDLNKALKTDKVEVKLATASKYFGLGEQFGQPGADRKARRRSRSSYEKSLPLLEELRALTRGDTTYERVSYMYAKSYFGIKDYVLGGYYLEDFTKTFPASRYAEECAFLSALCYFRESPEHELDQQATNTAIDQLQLFMVRYPSTMLKDSCNTLMDKLRGKLEEKDHNNAMLYVRTRNYEAAGVALRNFLRKWPNSRYREEVMFNILLTDHDLAVNSVEQKKKARVQEGLRSFDTFADAYPESRSINDAQRLRQELIDLLERLNRTTQP